MKTQIADCKRDDKDKITRFSEVRGSRYWFSPVFGCSRYTGLLTDLLAPGTEKMLNSTLCPGARGTVVSIDWCIGIEIRQLLSLEMAIGQIEKSEKYETFCVSKIPIWRQKWFAVVPPGNSLLVLLVPPGKIKIMLFWTKYAVPRQIKRGIVKLTIRRGQSPSNLSIDFYFVCFVRKGYYRVVSGLVRSCFGRTANIWLPLVPAGAPAVYKGVIWIWISDLRSLGLW